MLQIKNTLGGGKPEGLYAWKKYDLVKKYNINSVKYSTPSNPIDVTALCNEKDGNFYLPCFSSNSYTVNSEGYFEFSNIASRKYISIPSDGSTINFDNALGIYRYFCLQSTNFPDKGSDLIMSPTANEIFDQNMADSYTYAKYDSSTDRVIVYEQYASNYFIGLTTEEYYEPNLFIDYIVSDKETAYPDGGEKGGYWYERVTDGLETLITALNTLLTNSGYNLKGILHEEDITPTGNVTTLPHTYGKTPTAYIVYALSDVTNTTSNYYVQSVMCYVPHPYQMAKYVYSGSNTSTDSSINNYGTSETGIRVRYSTTYMYFKSGVTYRLIVLA